jgi:hypothetical protein
MISSCEHPSWKYGTKSCTDSLLQQIVISAVTAVACCTIYRAAATSFAEQEINRRAQAKFQYSEI